MTATAREVVEQVRPHDLRPGDRIVVAGEVRRVLVAALPSFTDRSHRMVAVTDQGRVSWSLDAARWPCVDRVVSDRRVA